MSRLRLNIIFSSFILSTFLAGAPVVIFGQQPVIRSQERSDADGQPVLLKHLPDYEKVKAVASFATDKAGVNTAIGNNLAVDALEFPSGTEAVTAVYPEGRLLIVEYTNPQSSVDADVRVRQLAAAGTSDFVYRRIGNYNAFVFDPTDTAAASELLDQVKYEKTVQWLGEDPYILKKLERYMVTTSRDVMISTVLVIVLGLAVSVLAGIVAGLIFFRVRDQKRAHRAAFSDSGGLTRLNLDGLSE